MDLLSVWFVLSVMAPPVAVLAGVVLLAAPRRREPPRTTVPIEHAVAHR